MIKKRVFIGSSSEEIKVAELVKELLSSEFDVVIWNEKVWDEAIFKLNQNFLNSLLVATLQFDFGILIGSQDDKVIYREVEVLKPRDNVLFELGLFTGRLGSSKCAFLIDKSITLPSDLLGITLARYNPDDSTTIIEAVKTIKSLFLASSEEEVNFFPSATLATVYYENLVIPLCKYLIENKGFLKDEIHYSNCKLKIIVPNKINDDVNLQFEKLKSKFSVESVSFHYSGRPRNITVDTQINDGLLEFVDFPTIISGINHAISNLLPMEYSKQSSDYELILNRELRRFITTLKNLLIKGGFDEMVQVTRESDM